MAYGVPPKNTHTLPSGRRPFQQSAAHESTKRLVSGRQSEIIKSGTRYGDGQDRAGVSGIEHTGAGKPGYLSAAGHAHRAAMGNAPPGNLPDNRKVASKNVKRYGRQGSKGDFPNSSTGEQPASQQHDDIAPSIPQRSYPRTKPHHEVVGWLNGKQHGATHPNTQRHDGGHISGAHTNTDAAPGQAHAASGGKFGRPQIRPKSVPRQGVNRRDSDSGSLERTAYNPPRK